MKKSLVYQLLKKDFSFFVNSQDDVLKESEEKLKVECSQNVSPIPWGCWLINIQKKRIVLLPI